MMIISNKTAKKGFALIYVLLLLVLIGITIFATWAGGLSDMRMAQKTESASVAQQLAKSAIDQAWSDYRQQLGTTANTIINIPSPAACSTSDPAVVRVKVSDGTSSNKTLKTPVSLTDAQKGVYDYRICYTSDINYLANYIEGVGYYRGSKITLRANIKHNDGYICTFDNPTDLIAPQLCGNTKDTTLTCAPTEQYVSDCQYDHKYDMLEIFQKGPS